MGTGRIPDDGPPPPGACETCGVRPAVVWIRFIREDGTDSGRRPARGLCPECDRSERVAMGEDVTPPAE